MCSGIRAAGRGIVVITLLVLSGTPATAGPLRMPTATLFVDQEEAAWEVAADRLPDGVRLLRDIAYGTDARQRFDVYLPPAAHGAPVIFLVHGGGWRRGDKAMAAVVENKVARWVPRGLVVVSTNYRMVPDADPIEQARDVARALAAAQAQAADWGADPARFVLMGHSAGAHLVALLTADPALAAEVVAHPWLGTVALDSGGYDVAAIMEGRHYRLYDTAFGDDPAFWRAASPTHVLTTAGAPLLAVCSTRRAAPCPQARQFAAKAAGLGMRVAVLPQDLSHRDINQDLGEEGGYTAAVEGFLASLDPELALRLRP